MELLTRFAAFSLACGALMTLLPEGTIRRTARLVTGLMILVLWAEGLQGILSGAESNDIPRTILTPSASGLEERSAQAAADLARRMEELP